MLYIKKILPVLAVLLIAILSGCGTSPAAGINPYVYVSKVDQVDHTPFFIETYAQFLHSGLVVTDNTTTTTTTTTTTNTNNLSGLLGY